MPKPATRDSGYREYSETDLEKLRLIVAAKRQRFPLKLIRTVLDAFGEKPDPCAEIATLVRGRIAAIDEEVRELQALQTHLHAQLSAWEQGTLPKSDCLCAILQTNALQQPKEK